MDTQVNDAIDRLMDTAFKIKDERDRMRAALRDIVFGADMMLQFPKDDAFTQYASEVKRVAEIALRGES